MARPRGVHQLGACLKEDISNSVTAAKDPVCGMKVEPRTAKHRLEHAGESHYFCSAHCAQKFRADPEKYLGQTTGARASGLVTLGMPPVRPSPVPANLASLNPVKSAHPPDYVCPMCPQVRQRKPGTCPGCGTVLAPEIPLGAARDEYTCPMHPEIVRLHPGSCPIC